MPGHETIGEKQYTKDPQTAYYTTQKKEVVSITRCLQLQGSLRECQ